MDKINSYSLSICLLLYGWLLIATNGEHGLSKTSRIWIVTSLKIRQISNLKESCRNPTTFGLGFPLRHIPVVRDSNNCVSFRIWSAVEVRSRWLYDCCLSWWWWWWWPTSCFTWPTQSLPLIFYSCGFFVFSSPILIGRGLDVYHTSTHDVALVRI